MFAGLDGAIRVIDHSVSLGYDDVADASMRTVGLSLRVRRPYPDKSQPTKSKTVLVSSSIQHTSKASYPEHQKNQSGDETKASSTSVSTAKTRSRASKTPEINNKSITASTKIKGSLNLMDSTAKMPIFELANLTKYERRINTNKLRLFLEKNGTNLINISWLKVQLF